MSELTEEQKELKQKIEEKRKELYKIQEELDELLDHEHVVKKANYASVECVICGADFGWYCPDSPDHVCHYFSRNGKVTLISGEKILKPDNAEENESDDWCIFCGQPEERK